MLSIRYKLFFFLLLLLLCIVAGMHLFLERNAVKAIYERESVAARNILRVVNGDINHYYRNKVAYKLEKLVRRRELMREAVALAVDHLEEMHSMTRQGVLSTRHAMQQSAAWLREHGYGSGETGGRFIVFNSSLTGIVHPDAAWEGRTWVGFENLKGRDALTMVLQDVQRTGEEFTVMHWTGDCNGHDGEHLGYFTYFGPWNWVIGTTYCLDRIKQEVQRMENDFIEHLQEFLDSAATELDGTLLVTGSNGEVVASSSPKTGTPKTGAPADTGELVASLDAPDDDSVTRNMVERKTAAGPLEYAVFSQFFKPLRWRAHYLVSERSLMQPARALMQSQLKLLTIMFALSLIPLFILVRRFTVPLTVLAEHARDLPTKDFQSDAATLKRVEDLSRANSDETGQLAGAFAAMQRRLDSYIREVTQTSAEKEEFARKVQAANERLERRVDERTKDLNQANVMLKAEIQERTAISRMLIERNAQLQGIFDHAPLLIWLKDPKGRITMANNRFVEFFHLQGRELEGKRIEEVCEGDLAAFSAKDMAVLETMEMVTDEERLQLQSSMFVLITARFPLFDDSGRVFAVCGVALDISEKKLLEAKTFRAAHLASLGELSAVVAHEINNPINGVINSAEIMVDDPRNVESVDKFSRLIIKEGERISTIVSSLLSYVRNNDQSPEAVDVKELIDEVLLFNNLQLCRGGVHLECDIPSDVPRIKGRAQELKQVFLNLVHNAREALQEKYPEPHENKILRILTEPGEDHMLRISVLDHGQGIRPEDLSRVYDSFFTTKSASQGTGLGLYISNQIVDRHGGKLTITSDYGHFTRISVDLPLWPSKD